jgi:hypothetical protein
VRLVFLLSSDKPHGGDGDDAKVEPEFLSQKTPDFVLEWLEAPARSSKELKPETPE